MLSCRAFAMGLLRASIKYEIDSVPFRLVNSLAYNRLALSQIDVLVTESDGAFRREICGIILRAVLERV